MNPWLYSGSFHMERMLSSPVPEQHAEGNTSNDDQGRHDQGVARDTAAPGGRSG